MEAGDRREEKGRGRDGRPGGRAPQIFWARTATAEMLKNDCRGSFG
jgi:hypothetical protein